jgi:hypothetical protein
MTPDEALTAPVSAPDPAELRLPSGLRARVEGENGGERLEVRDARGRAVLILHDDGTVELASARDLVLRAHPEHPQELMTGAHERLSAGTPLFVLRFLGAGTYAWRQRRAELAQERGDGPSRF